VWRSQQPSTSHQTLEFFPRQHKPSGTQLKVHTGQITKEAKPMFKWLVRNKTTEFQQKRKAAPDGIQTKTIKQIQKETKKKLGITETEADFKRRLKQIRENFLFKENQ
jgi:hypothetical protein